MKISNDLEHIPIIFIWFNSDNYNINSIPISSCWELNKNGICVIKNSKKK